jgi:hypothetical protein
MTTAPLLWPIVVCIFSILFAPTLLFATTLLEHLIASPELNHDVLRRRRRMFLSTEREGEANEPPHILARSVPDRPRGGVGLEGGTRSPLTIAGSRVSPSVR